MAFTAIEAYLSQPKKDEKAGQVLSQAMGFYRALTSTWSSVQRGGVEYGAVALEAEVGTEAYTELVDLYNTINTAIGTVDPADMAPVWGVGGSTQPLDQVKLTLVHLIDAEMERRMNAAGALIPSKGKSVKIGWEARIDWAGMGILVLAGLAQYPVPVTATDGTIITLDNQTDYFEAIGTIAQTVLAARTVAGTAQAAVMAAPNEPTARAAATAYLEP